MRRLCLLLVLGLVVPLLGTSVSASQAEGPPGGAGSLGLAEFPESPPELQPGAGQFVPVPTSSPVSAVALAKGATTTVTVTGVGGVPAADQVSAVAVQVTGKATTTAGFVELYPGGATRPADSTNYVYPSRFTTSYDIVPVSATGQITVYASEASTVYVRMRGYMTSADASSAGSAFVPLSPTIVANSVALAAGETHTVTVAGANGVPDASAVSAVALEILSSAPTAAGSMKVYPAGATAPGDATLYYESGQSRANHETVRLSSDGKVTVSASAATKLYVRLRGYYAKSTETTAGSRFVPTAHTTVVNNVSLAAGGTTTVALAGANGVPAASSVSAVAANITAFTPTAAGFIAAYPAGSARPNDTSVHFANGVTSSAMDSVRISSGGQTTFYASNTTKLLVRLRGYFSKATVPSAPLNVTAVGGDEAATVTWEAPASDGGAAITGYRVTVEPGGGVIDVGNQLGAEIDGLDNGTVYRMTVAAKNAVGHGPTGASNPVAPLGRDITYVHDAAGRLTAVLGESGNGVKYTYDDNDNVLSIKAVPADELSVVQAVPNTVAVGDSIEVYGSGFGTDAGAVSATIGGVAAEVTNLRRNQLTVKVPTSAQTGDLVIKVGTATANAGNITVLRPPTISSVSSAVVDRSATFTVSGTGFAPDPAANLAWIGAARADVVAATATSLTLRTPRFAAVGPIKVKTRAGQVVGTTVVTVPPAPFLAVDVAASRALTVGTAASVTTTAPNQIALFYVKATAGRRLGFRVVETFSGATEVHVWGPDNKAAYAKEEELFSSSFPDLEQPSKDGYYLLQIDPRDPVTGQATVTAEEQPDTVENVTIDGPAISASVAARPAHALFRFNGTAGNRVFVTVKQTTGAAEQFTLRDPSGRALATANDFPGGEGYLPGTLLPSTGTYTVDVDTSTAPATFQAAVSSVPAAAEATATIDGSDGNVTITKRGQFATIKFSGTKDAIIHADLIPTGFTAGRATLIGPDGFLFRDQAWTTFEEVSLDRYKLPTTGDYSILIEPGSGATGSMTVSLNTVPADAQATGALDATTSFGNTKPGQNAVLSFDVAAQSRAYVKCDQPRAADDVNYTLRTASGTFLDDSFCRDTTGGLLVDNRTLAAGQYRLTMDPKGSTVLTAPVSIKRASADQNPSTTVGGATVPLTLEPAQDARIGFDITAGQAFTVQCTATVTAPADRNWIKFSLIRPNGTAEKFPFQCPTNGIVGAVAAPAAGRWTAVVDSQLGIASEATVRVTAGAAAAASSAAKADDVDLAMRISDKRTASLSGRLLRTNGRPAANVRVGVADRFTRTDANGRFNLTGLPAGTWLLSMDGRKASPASGFFDVQVSLKAGRNRLQYQPYLPTLDRKHEIPFPGGVATEDVVLTNPRVPGLEVHIPKGTRIKDADGNPVDRLGITPIPVNRTPIPMPKGVQVPVYFTIQPAGGDISYSHIQIVYPNYLDQQPGTKVDFWTHEKWAEGWEVYGEGTVNGDGTQVIPSEGTYIENFDGAMISVPGWLAGLTRGLLEVLGSAGDPVDLSTGRMTFTHTDLSLGGSIPMKMERGYSSGDGRERSFGWGSIGTYDTFLTAKPGTLYEDPSLNLIDGTTVPFVRVAGSAFNDAIFEAQTVSPMFAGAKLVWVGRGWDLTLRDGTVLNFGENAPLQSIRDRHGNTVTIRRIAKNSHGNQIGAIKNVSSNDGYWMDFEYDASGHVTKVTDNTSRSVSYTYEGDGDLSTVTDVNGGVTTYTWDANHRLDTITDAKNQRFLDNDYDAKGRVSKQTLADGGTYTFAYTDHADGKVATATVVDPEGIKRVVTYSAAGYMTSDRQAVGTSLERRVDIGRNPSTQVPATIDDSAGVSVSSDYNQDIRATETTYTSNGATRTISATYGGPDGAMDSVTDALGRTTRYEFDNNGNVDKVTDPTDRSEQMQWDDQGHLTATIDGAGNQTNFEWRDGQLESVTDPEGRQTRYLYDDAGRPIGTVAPDGGHTSMVLDKANQLKSLEDPLGRTTSFEYDKNGNLTKRTDPRQGTWNFVPDSMDHTRTATDPLGRATTYTHTRLGEPSTVTDRNGDTTEFKYDALRRLEFTGYGRTGSQPPYSYGSTQTFAYNERDQLISVSDTAQGAGTATFGYDDWGNIDHETSTATNATFTVARKFDAEDRLEWADYTGLPRATYGYDDAGRMTSVAQGTLTSTMTYDNAGQVKTQTLPGAVTKTWTYDRSGRPDNISFANPAEEMGALRYGYNRAGLLSRESGSYARTDLPALFTGANYDAANRLQSVGGDTFSYDNEGNLTGRTGTSGAGTYNWNNRGQLTATTGLSGSSAIHYDALGRRASATLGGKDWAYLYDGHELVAQDGPTAAEDIVYGRTLSVDDAFGYATGSSTGGRPNASDPARGLLTDRLGSTIATTKPGTVGELDSTYSYQPYGAATSSSGADDPNTARYTGRESGPGAPGGLQYQRARWYDPSLGRFISQDPAEQAGSGNNLYAYTGANPVDATDPSGKFWNYAAACAGNGAVNVIANGLLGRKNSVGDYLRGFALGCAEGVFFLGVSKFIMRGLPSARAAASSVDDLGETAVNLCRTNSFTADTPVLMADGTKKPIKDVRLGDKVMASDPITGERGARPVIDLIRHSGAHTMVSVTLDDGTLIQATDRHPFRIDGPNGRWKDAIELQAGDELVTDSGESIGVERVAVEVDDLVAYNLTVAGLHTYYAGHRPVLVHNSGCDEWAETFARSPNEIRTFESPLGRQDGWLGPYRPGGPGTPAVDENWGHHTVVVRDGQVFDQWHPDGVSISEFKEMWDYGDVINFGF